MATTSLYNASPSLLYKSGPNLYSYSTIYK